MENYTVDQMNKLVEEIAALRLEEERASQVKKEITDKLTAKELQALTALEQLGMKSYRGPAGTVSVDARTSVKVPKTKEHREAFFNFLREKGLYDMMITVNSQTINSFYKSEFEAARERGDADFAIPGLTEVTISPVVKFRRG